MPLPTFPARLDVSELAQCGCALKERTKLVILGVTTSILIGLKNAVNYRWHCFVTSFCRELLECAATFRFLAYLLSCLQVDLQF